MRRWTLSAVLILLTVGGVSTVFSQVPVAGVLAQATPTSSAAAADVDVSAGTGAGTGEVERGSYLVHSASMCVQCHSPRDRQGNLAKDRLLEGGAIPVQSPFSGPRWAFHAPNIKRAPGYTEEELVRLLTQGTTRDGRTPRAPMPPFRLTVEDAKAIHAYLTSL